MISSMAADMQNKGTTCLFLGTSAVVYAIYLTLLQQAPNLDLQGKLVTH